jgi:hypothetical protein
MLFQICDTSFFVALTPLDGKVLLFYAVEGYGGVDLWLNSFLSLALDGGGQSGSRYGCVILRSEMITYIYTYIVYSI